VKVARPTYPRAGEPLPAPLPPETRTVGQLVAETIRLYGNRFWATLPLGLSLAALGAVGFERSVRTQTLLLWAFAPLVTLSFVFASAVVTETPLTRRRALVALAAGLVVFLPFPVLLRLYILPGLVWFALIGLAVPAAVVEGGRLRDALKRGIELGGADRVHAIGGVVTLALVYVLSRLVLLFLLRSQGDQTLRVAGFLADLVLAPLVFVGSAMLYVDQRARER
jgi:hypothetical protein